MVIKAGISGLRGTADGSDESLDADVILRWTQAFVTDVGAHGVGPVTIALGRDGRRSSDAVVSLVKGAVMALGAHVRDLELTVTPTLQKYARDHREVDGGIMVTASHNPLVWNGLKFLGGDGLFVGPEVWERLRALRKGAIRASVPLDETGRVEPVGRQSWLAHQDAIIAALSVDILKARRFRVVLDACNSGAVLWQETLEAIGCEVTVIHGDLLGYFERGPEPVPKNLGALRSRVLDTHSDIGLAADPDGDRLTLVDGNGDSVSEEHTVVLCALAVTQPGDRVVTNVVTTHALEDALDGVDVVRTAVGELNVVAGMVAVDAVIAGEGSGGVIYPRMNFARDGLAAAGLVLSLMARKHLGLAELVARIPNWETVKVELEAGVDEGGLFATVCAALRDADDIAVTATTTEVEVASGTTRCAVAVSSDGVMITLVNQHGGANVTSTDEAIRVVVAAALEGDLQVDIFDGLKIRSAGAWFALRASNTEPIFRLSGQRRA